MIVYIIVSIPASWVIDTTHKVGVGIGAALTRLRPAAGYLGRQPGQLQPGAGGQIASHRQPSC